MVGKRISCSIAVPRSSLGKAWEVDVFLVVDPTPLRNIWVSQLGLWDSHYMEKQKHFPNQVAGAWGAWRFVVFLQQNVFFFFSFCSAVVGVVLFHQLDRVFQYDQWCTSLEITSPYILLTMTSQRWIHLWPHQTLHFSVKIGKTNFFRPNHCRWICCLTGIFDNLGLLMSAIFP